MYTIKVPVGLHARHAGILVKAASPFQAQVTVECRGRQADGKRILGLMGLGVHQGDLVRVSVSGEDEDAAARALKACFWEHF